MALLVLAKRNGRGCSHADLPWGWMDVGCVCAPCWKVTMGGYGGGEATPCSGKAEVGRSSDFMNIVLRRHTIDGTCQLVIPCFQQQQKIPPQHCLEETRATDGEDGRDDEGTNVGVAGGQLDPATRAVHLLWIRGAIATSCNSPSLAAGWRWIRSRRRQPKGLPNPALPQPVTSGTSKSGTLSSRRHCRHGSGVGPGRRSSRGWSEWGGAWRGVVGQGSDAGWFSAGAAGNDMEKRGDDRWSGGG